MPTQLSEEILIVDDKVKKVQGKMKKSEFWRRCDYCGATNIEDWESHIKECPKIPQNEKEVILKMGKGINEDDFSEEVKRILKNFTKPKKCTKPGK